MTSSLLDNEHRYSAVRKTIIVGATVLAAVVVAAAYLGNDSGGKDSGGNDSGDDSAVQTAATLPSTSNQQTGNGPGVPEARHDPVSQDHASAQPGSTDAKPLPADPRLAALAVSPDNGLIEFVVAPDGKVIKEIDRDPASPGFGKPSREYIYSGDKVVGLTAYRYMSDHVEIARTAVSYKSDGSVDEFVESTSYSSEPTVKQ